MPCKFPAQLPIIFQTVPIQPRSNYVNNAINLVKCQPPLINTHHQDKCTGRKSQAKKHHHSVKSLPAGRLHRLGHEWNLVSRKSYKHKFQQ